MGLSRAPILLSSSINSGESWNDISSIETNLDGGFTVVWIPSATGNYLVRANWAGNATHRGSSTIISLGVTAFEEQTVFSVTSNSTVSELAFNSTSNEFSFSVSGPSNTAGYIDAYIAKAIVAAITDVKIYLDGNQLTYDATSIDDSWLLHFTYQHSTHTVVINLGQPQTQAFAEIPFGYIIVIFGIVILTGFILMLTRKKDRITRGKEAE